MTDPTPKRPAFQAHVKIRNLGAIKEADLDLRPLTVIFGKNGVNKTWAAYSIYAALQQGPLLCDDVPPAVEMALDRFAAAVGTARTEAIGRAVSGRLTAFDFDMLGMYISAPVRADLSLLVSAILPHLRWQVSGWQVARLLAIDEVHVEATRVLVQEIENGRPISNLSGHSVKTAVDPEEFRDHPDGSAGGDDPQRVSALSERPSSQSWSLVISDDDARPYQTWGRALSNPEPLKSMVAESILNAIGRFWRPVRGAIPLPAERKALAAIYRELDALGVLRARERRRIERGVADHGDGLVSALQSGRADGLLAETPLPSPSGELVRWLASMQNRSRTAVVHARTEGRFGSKLGQLVAEIVGGQMTFSEPDEVSAAVGSGAGPLVFRFGDGQELPFHAAASLARSMGLLDIWLRESAQPGDLVLIDEPEMNAHPETQVKIAELLAMMINAGLRVIITTHSPYLVEHLEGLMLGSRLDAEAKARFVPRLGLQSADAFLDPEDLAAYHFEEQQGGEVKVLNALDRADCSIDWGTFSRPRTYIGNLINNILAEISPEQADDDHASS